MGGMRGGSDNEMVVTVLKKDLIEILTKNLSAHVKDFEEACVVYKQKVIEEVSASRKKLKKYVDAFAIADFLHLPEYPDVFQRLPQPISFAGHYERALGMLKLHSKDELTIDMSTYQKYVEDDWEWSAQAKMSTSMYLGNGR